MAITPVKPTMLTLEHELESNGQFLKKMSAAVIGNVLEWYDFAVFGAVAPEIASLFFPKQNGVAAFLETFGVFGAAFLMRPVGGMLLGYFGDKFGRKRALEISIMLMLFPSFLVGCLPTYSSVGIAAPLLLVLLRLCQGIAVGGELVGSILFVVESAPPTQKGLMGAICFSGATLGTALGAGVGVMVRSSTTKEQFESWGWRILFWVSLAGGLVGLWLRKGLKDSEEFTEAVKNKSPTSARNPITAAIKDKPREVVIVCGVTSIWCCGYYLSFIWLPVYMASMSQTSTESPYTVSFCMQLLLLVAFPMMGHISDLIKSRLRVMMFGASFLCICSVFCFWLISEGSLARVVLANLFFVIGCSAIGGPMSSWMSEAFPVEIRFSAVAIGYNFAQAIFGGTAPLVATALSSVDHYAPAFYLSGVALFALFSMSVPRCIFGAELHASMHARDQSTCDGAKIELVEVNNPAADDTWGEIDISDTGTTNI